MTWDNYNICWQIGHVIPCAQYDFTEDAQVNKCYNYINLQPIEINLRKGGTTHPFRIAYYLTKSKYNKRDGILYCGKTPIYYMARDVIESEKYKDFSSSELIKTVDKSKISSNKNTKKGVLIYMPGMISEFGRFGALAVGHTKEEAESYFKIMIKAVDLRATRKINKNI